MSSLAEKIAELTNPKPKISDPECDINEDDVAKIYETSETDDVSYNVSELRQKTAPLLEDIDPKYVGRKISRKSLAKLFYEDEISDAEGHEDASKSESDDDDDINDDDLAAFKNQLHEKEIEDEASEEDMASMDEDDEESGEDEPLEGDETEEDDADEDESLSNSMTDQFSMINVASEMEKGEAVKKQQELWNKLCEFRIKLQKLLILANRLPQYDSSDKFKEKGGKGYSECQDEAASEVKNLLNNLLGLQTELLNRNAEVKTLNQISEKQNAENQDSSQHPIDDEEIPSDSDEEKLEESHENTANQNIPSLRKRKLKDDDYLEVIEKRHKLLIPYRNTVIQKWDDKTKLASGKMAQKSFLAFETSAVKQIDQILQDRNRIIKRTQLKRTLYHVLGKPEIDENEDLQKLSKQDILQRHQDPEIFDDDDFYRQMLKDIIENKSVGVDPAVLKKQMEIQKIRSKMKRKVDTKASKGRKLRFDVHPKMVNFMAPLRISTMSGDARDGLLKSVFGRQQT